MKKEKQMEELLITQVLRKDHQDILRHLEQLKSSLGAFDSKSPKEKREEAMQLASDLADDMQRIQMMLKLQNKKEENVFYPVLEKLYSQSESVKKPWLELSFLFQEHQEIEKRLEMFRHRIQQSAQDDIPLEIAELKYSINRLEQLITAHFNKEDNILSPLVDLSLNDEHKRELVARLQKQFPS